MSGVLDLKTVCPDPGPADECLALQEKPLQLRRQAMQHVSFPDNCRKKRVLAVSDSRQQNTGFNYGLAGIKWQRNTLIIKNDAREHEQNLLLDQELYQYQLERLRLPRFPPLKRSRLQIYGNFGCEKVKDTGGRGRQKEARLNDEVEVGGGWGGGRTVHDRDWLVLSNKSRESHLSSDRRHRASAKRKWALETGAGARQR